MTEDAVSAGALLEINVGEMTGQPGNGLRLWCAREALRQAEMRVAGQTDALGLMVSRASSALGWTVTLALALVAASSTFRRPADVIIPVSCLVLAAVSFLVVIWPKSWHVVGDEAEWLLTQPYDSELEITEALAIRAAEASGHNAKRLSRRGWCLRIGNSLMLLAGCVALALVPWALAFGSGLAAGLAAWVVGVAGR